VKDTVAHCPYMHALLVIVISAGARLWFCCLMVLFNYSLSRKIPQRGFVKFFRTAENF